MDFINLPLPNYTRVYKICTGDIIEYTLSEFLKPININMLMNNKFQVIGYGKRKDYWLVRLFDKYKKIPKPFKYIKTVKLEYIGE